MSNQPDPIRGIRTELINHADPIVQQAYEYIVDLELEHAQQKHDLEAEVERLRAALRRLVKACEADLDTRRCRTSSLRTLNEARIALGEAQDGG